ncbi:hypothetical protein L1987_44900 [Smallanthus sonchifolius]|uniref:Uncharacterized protein n=1 Tax=Smallanthus sonchifolius TaxID=185202 RepID=A0ACB9GQK7_9ASTR|nr:hypothetical protein L1987_44900 [Smallanthus sonchifolius]
MDGLKEDQSEIEPINNINEDTKSITEKEDSEKEMAPPIGNSIHRSSSRPQLDLSGAAIQGNFEERDPTILLPNQSDDISHLALDIGGSLIKLVYFSRHEKERFGVTNGSRRSFPILGGRLHFVKFETSKINECLEFIHSKQLHRGDNDNAVIKATGGGAYKFADLFKEKLGVVIDKEDEMNCQLFAKGDSP